MEERARDVAAERAKRRSSEARREATTPDADLALAAREDPTGLAFRALYDRHRGEVHRFLLRLLDDAPLAEDALQEAFFRAYWHLDRYDPARAFRPWLLTIARNVALNALRARKKGGAPPTDDAPERAVSDRVVRHTAAREDALAAREALATLDDEDRALLVMRHGLGLKLEELAAALGCTERTVRNRLHAALDRLTRSLLTGGRS